MCTQEYQKSPSKGLSKHEDSLGKKQQKKKFQGHLDSQESTL